MPAPLQNQNALKWTHAETISKLREIRHYAERDNILTLGQALQRSGVYRDLWKYWRKRWRMDGEVMERMLYIEEVCINKLEVGALTRRLHPGSCQFMLRYSYKVTQEEERQPREEWTVAPHLREMFTEARAEDQRKDQEARRAAREAEELAQKVARQKAKEERLERKRKVVDQASMTVVYNKTDGSNEEIITVPDTTPSIEPDNKPPMSLFMQMLRSEEEVTSIIF